MKYLSAVILILIVGLGLVVVNRTVQEHEPTDASPVSFEQDPIEVEAEEEHPFSISYMRKQEYPGSDIVIVEDLPRGSNYTRHIASYESEGLTIYGLMTIPEGDMPETGWPGIVFNHGHIPPAQYRTTERYVAYQDGFARNGYVTYKIDYRGHGDSDGRAEGGQGDAAYTIDVLNAFTSMQQDPRIDANRIGMWGHSMGGSLLVRAMVINPAIKAGVSWAGVVGPYEQVPPQWFSTLYEEYGEPDTGPFWQSVSPIYHLADISGPVQLHHTTGDDSVDVIMSEIFHEKMQEAGKISELYVYQGDDHNISQNFSTAMQRSIEFFDTYVKNI